MAFPQTTLDLRAELLAGGAWTDVSPNNKLYQRQGTSPPAVITRGRPDEASTAQPSSATFQANNRNGNLSPKNPLGIWYGQLGRNTPVRLSVPAQTSYLRFENDNVSTCSTPSSSALNVPGDLDVQIDCQVTFSSAGWSVPLINKWGASGQLSWWVELHTDGTVHFIASLNGSTQEAATTVLQLPPGRIAIRVTYASATGTVTWYTAPTIAGPWTQFGGTAQFATGGALFASTAPVMIGGTNAGQLASITGNVYGAKILNGIGGTVVASPDFTSATPGATSVTDAQGNVWTPNGTAEISGRNYRFHGEMSSLPPKWDTTSTDVYVAVTAGGLLRRVSQGQSPVMSPIKRATLLQSGNLRPLAYWPCEDASGATSLGSATGGTAMTFNPAPAPNLAADSSFICSSPLMTLNGAVLHGKVPPYQGGTLTAVVRFLAKLVTVPSSGSKILARVILSGTVAELRVSAYPGGALGLSGYDNTGFNLFDTGAVAFAAAGVPLMYSVEATSTGFNQSQYALVTQAPGASAGLATSVIMGNVAGNVTDVYVNPDGFFGDSVFGHCQVQDSWVSMGALGQPLNAWQGETAGTRFARLCSENGYTARIIGAPSVTAAMGAQSIDTLQNLLQECEDADRGQIFEPRQVLGFGYRTLASMLNQSPAAIVDYELTQAGGNTPGGGDSGLDPTYDDQRTRNDVTVTRGGPVTGGTYRFQLNDGSSMSISAPPAGAGDYATSMTLYVASDTQLRDEAGWIVHTGTVDEARWPVIPVNLARSAVASLYYPLLHVDIGDYVQLVNLLNQVTYDPVKQLVYGCKESLGGFFHQLEWNAVPESPYEVMVLDDPVYGRADTDGSVLSAVLSAPLNPNPFAAEGSTADWQPYNAGDTVTASQAQSGGPLPWSLLLTTLAGSAFPGIRTVAAQPASASSPYGASCYVYYPAGGSVLIGIGWNGSGGYTETLTTVTVPAAAWTPVASGALTSPAGTTTVKPVLKANTGSAPAGPLLYEQGLMVWAGGVTAASTAGPAWTQAAADFPFDVGISGERVTVTSIAQAAQPLCRVGAFLSQSGMGVADFNGARSAWNTLTGQNITVTRWYKAQGDFTYDTNMQEMVAAGVKICLTLRPNYAPVSSAHLASIATLLSTLQAAGAQVDVTLWHEPYYSGLSAAQYIAMVQYYGPTVRQYYPLVFVTSAFSAHANGELSYYPGDAYVDKVATDIYCDAYNGGARLSETAAQADGAIPPKPFGIWEVSGSTDPIAGQSSSQVTTFLNYVQAYMTGRAAQGLVNADILWFNGGNAPLVSSTFEDGLADGWGSSANCTVANSTAQANTGTHSLAITATASGNASAGHGAGSGGGATAVTPNTAYSLAGFLRAATTARSVQVGINWYTSGGGFISSSFAGTVSDSTSAWTQSAVGATAPGTAAFADLIAQVVSAGASEVHYLDDALFMQQDQDVTLIGTGFGSSPSSDYRIPLYQSLTTALNNTSYPQAFTCARGINGVPKAQSAGAGVRLWYPPILSMV